MFAGKDNAHNVHLIIIYICDLTARTYFNCQYKIILLLFQIKSSASYRIKMQKNKVFFQSSKDNSMKGKFWHRRKDVIPHENLNKVPEELSNQLSFTTLQNSPL